MASSSMPNFCPEHLPQVRPVQSHRLPQSLHVRIEGRQIDRVEFRLVPRYHREQGGSERHDTHSHQLQHFLARQPTAVERVDFRLDPPFRQRLYAMVPERLLQAVVLADTRRGRPRSSGVSARRQRRSSRALRQPSPLPPFATAKVSTTARRAPPTAAAGSLSYGNPRQSFVDAVLVQGCHQEYTIPPFAGHFSVKSWSRNQNVTR